MPKLRRSTSFSSSDEALFHPKPRKTPPHSFVLEAISELSPVTKHMFGCLAVYVEEKIVLILRQRPEYTDDNGVWLATTEEHHESLRREFPNMRSIQLFEKKVTNWQILPVDAPDFEESSLRACELILTRDPRIGKIPKSRRRSRSKKAVTRGNPIPAGCNNTPAR
jgi:hypothetical protein